MKTKPDIPDHLLIGRDVRLTLIQDSDIDLIRRWRNRDDIRIWFGDAATISPEQQVNWYASYLGKTNDLVFLARSVETGMPVGTASLYGIDTSDGIAEFGRLIVGNPDFRGRGYGSDLTYMVCRIGFEALDLKRIVLQVRSANEPAISIYRYLGFETENRNADMQNMSLTRTSFGSHRWRE